MAPMLRTTPNLTLAALLALTAAVTGCATAPQQPLARATERVVVEPRAAETYVGAAIAALARDLVGSQYRYGGAKPDEGFDCSGLVFYTYARAGYSVPRTSQELFRTAHKIALGDAGAGDLMFFQDRTKQSFRTSVSTWATAGSSTRRPAGSASRSQTSTLRTTSTTWWPSAGCCRLSSLAPRRPPRIERRGARAHRSLAVRHTVRRCGTLPQADPPLIAARGRELVQRRARVEQRLLRRSDRGRRIALAFEREGKLVRHTILLPEHSLRVGAKIARGQSEPVAAGRQHRATRHNRGRDQ
jgi:hypothetical protein